MESKELIDKLTGTSFFIEEERSRLEQDAAYNHSCAIQEVFDVLQNGRIMAGHPNFSPIIMLMDPDLFIIDKNYFELKKSVPIMYSEQDGQFEIIPMISQLLIYLLQV